MSWINMNQRSRRIAFLVLLAVAVSGPWYFERIYVPPTYICSAPNIRLDENFCGMPVAITAFIPWFGRDLMQLVTTLAAGAIDPMSLLFFSFLLLLALPFLSTLVLILWEGRRRWRRGQSVLLGLGLTASVLIALLERHPALWGVWLYVAAAAAMLLLEVGAWHKQEAQL